MPSYINTDVLGELYKKSALLLTSPQRLAIKRIPNSIIDIMQHSQISVDSITHEKSYCIQSIKNTIKLSCRLIHEVNFLREHRERFVFAEGLNSNSAVLPVLQSIGYNKDQIAQSRVEESEFNGLKVEF